MAVSTNFEQLREIFNAAVEGHPPGEWEAYLDEACGDDAELRRQAALLLKAHEAGGSLSTSAPDTTTSTEPAHGAPGVEVDEGVGTVIGPYKLLQSIGEGGMGTVFMAEQMHPVRRRVALKLIRSGHDSRRVVARFEAERQALALMDHPNIARVFDAGTTDTGRPYFVMELVKGIPITRYCDEHQLTIRQRLELFVPVCQAVQHAHQKGIIHRDLKPSNILIAPYDGVPVPKVIDFGVAKAAGPRLTEQTLFTEFGAIVGTPDYMSPEQAELNQLDIDTRSDVYSLGVLLYELLTGSTPLTRRRLEQAALLEVLRRVREEEPPRPSVRLGTTEELPSIAASRGVEPRRIGMLVRGELDWIVMKALEKDRRRRYETASGFAADVRRHLDDEPVQACPPSAGYRLKKLARRHRAALATAAIVVAALVAGTAVSAWQAVRAIESERRAEAAQATAEQRSSLARRAVDEMYTKVAQDWLGSKGDLTELQREFLEKALAFYEEFAREQADDPEAQFEAARAAGRVGDIRSSLGLSAKAIESYRQAADACRRLAVAFPERPEYRQYLALYLRHIGLVHLETGRARDAESAYRESLALMEPLVEAPGAPQDRADLAHVLGQFGGLLSETGRAEEGVMASLRGIALLSDLVTESPEEAGYQYDLAQAENNLAGIYLDVLDRKMDAESLYRHSLETFQRLADARPADPRRRYELARAHHNLAGYFKMSSQPAEAVAEYQRALPIEDALAKEFTDRPSYLLLLAASLQRLGENLATLERFDEAERNLRRSREILERLVAESPDVIDYHSRLAFGLSELGQVLIIRGRDHEAREMFERSYDILKKFGIAYPSLNDQRHSLASLCYLAAVNYATFANPDDRDAVRACELARESVELEPGEPGFWKGLALAEYRAGNLDAALEAETRALELRKSDGYSYDWLLLGLIHLEHGDRDQARSWALRLLRGVAPGALTGGEPDYVRLAREGEPRLRASFPPTRRASAPSWNTRWKRPAATEGRTIRPPARSRCGSPTSSPRSAVTKRPKISSRSHAGSIPPETRPARLALTPGTRAPY